MIIWLTVNSGSGKTTLARALKARIDRCIILDGDEMRASISVGVGFSMEEREEHNLRVARLAKVMESQGFIIIVSVIAPFASTRAKINDIISCKWVYVKRDSIAGRPGYPYEAPENADLVVDSDILTADQQADLVVAKLLSK